MLTAYIDFKSAGSLLALDPVVELAKRHNLSIDWRPFRTANRDLPDSGADQGVIASHHAVRMKALRATDQKYAELRGMTLDFPDKETAADLALGALAEITGDRLPFIRAAFAAYWDQHRDLDDPLTIADIIASSQADHSGDLSATHDALASAQADAEAAGVVDAPAFVIDGQLFIGRQHLPWIEELVSSLSPS